MRSISSIERNSLAYNQNQLLEGNLLDTMLTVPDTIRQGIRTIAPEVLSFANNASEGIKTGYSLAMEGIEKAEVISTRTYLQMDNAFRVGSCFLKQAYQDYISPKAQAVSEASKEKAKKVSANVSNIVSRTSHKAKISLARTELASTFFMNSSKLGIDNSYRNFKQNVIPNAKEKVSSTFLSLKRNINNPLGFLSDTRGGRMTVRVAAMGLIFLGSRELISTGSPALPPVPVSSATTIPVDFETNITEIPAVTGDIYTSATPYHLLKAISVIDQQDVTPKTAAQLQYVIEGNGVRKRRGDPEIERRRKLRAKYGYLSSKILDSQSTFGNK